MRLPAALLLALALATTAAAETATPDTAVPDTAVPETAAPAQAPAPAPAPAAAPTYKQPYPHSSGADLLSYCEQTGVVVSQLRCDYYVQGVADLATIPRQGKPLACIPQGQNRTQLMQIAVTFLKAVKPDTLQAQSAASLILQAFTVAFPCPKEATKTPVPAAAPPENAEQLEAGNKPPLEAKEEEGGKN